MPRSLVSASAPLLQGPPLGPLCMALKERLSRIFTLAFCRLSLECTFSRLLSLSREGEGGTRRRSGPDGQSGEIAHASCWLSSRGLKEPWLFAALPPHSHGAKNLRYAFDVFLVFFFLCLLSSLWLLSYHFLTFLVCFFCGRVFLFLRLSVCLFYLIYFCILYCFVRASQTDLQFLFYQVLLFVFRAPVVDRSSPLLPLFISLQISFFLISISPLSFCVLNFSSRLFCAHVGKYLFSRALYFFQYFILLLARFHSSFSINRLVRAQSKLGQFSSLFFFFLRLIQLYVH